MTTFIICIGIFGALGISFIFSRRQDESEKLRAKAHMQDRPSLNPVGFGSHYFPPHQASVAAKVAEIFATHIDLDVSKAHPDDMLVHDLRMEALDSMSTVEFLLELEKHFGVTIPDKTAKQMRTLRDITDFITHVLHPSSRA